MTASRLRRQYRALALVAVLWAVVLLTIIVSVVAQSSRLDTRMCMAQTEQAKCRWACKAGAETAIGMLNADESSSDSLNDNWAYESEDLTDVELEGCTFSLKVIDEASKLNVNTASKAQLMELPGMNAEVADAIVDWRDRDDNPEPAGAEASYYLNLRPGYLIRNGRLRTIREMLLIKGVSEEMFYGQAAAANMGRIEEMPQAGSEYGAEEGWIEYLSCYSYDNNKDASGQKRTNINKADEKQLERSLNISAGQAKWIVNNRKGNYKNIGEILSDDSAKSGSQNQQGNDANVAVPIFKDTFMNIADKITVEDRNRIWGKVNVNTAGRVVLAAILKGDQAIADNIIAYRTHSAGGMTSVGELMNVNSMTVERFKEIAGLVTVRSNVFTIKVTAKSDSSNATARSEAVVDRSASPAAILYWRQGGLN